MFNTPFSNVYSPQTTVDRINNQIAELERMRNQISQNQQMPSINQTFQLTPNSYPSVKTMDNIEQVQKELVLVETPYFSNDMSIMWLKNPTGNIRTYELKEIIKKDEKDLQIEFLMAQIEELKKGKDDYAKSNDEYFDEPVESEEPNYISKDRRIKKK